MSLEAAVSPLSIAPWTLGLTQKSPQIANFLGLSHKHISSPATLTQGKALPLLYEYGSSIN